MIAFEPFDEGLVGGNGFDKVMERFVMPLRFVFRRIDELRENFFDDFTSFIFTGGGTSGDDDVRIGSDTSGVFDILSAEQGLKCKRSGKRIDWLLDVRNGIHVLGEVADEPRNVEQMRREVVGAIVVALFVFVLFGFVFFTGRIGNESGQFDGLRDEGITVTPRCKVFRCGGKIVIVFETGRDTLR